MDDSRIYSCDDHLDLYAVPPRLWESRLPKELAERGPRVVTRDGQSEVGLQRPAGRPERPAEGRQPLQRPERGRACRPRRRRLPGQRSEAPPRGHGPRRGLGLGHLRAGPADPSIPEPDLQDVCYAAWNDWAIEEFNAAAPDRLCVLPFLPSHSPDAAVSRARALGDERAPRRHHRRLRIRRRRSGLGAAVGGRRAHRPSAQLPRQRQARRTGSATAIGKWQSAAFASLLPLQLDEALAIMIFSGALERHPGSPAGARRGGRRLASVLPDPDGPRVEEPPRQIDYAPSVPPSELFRRQVIATFEEEEHGRSIHP